MYFLICLFFFSALTYSYMSTSHFSQSKISPLALILRVYLGLFISVFTRSPHHPLSIYLTEPLSDSALALVPFHFVNGGGGKAEVDFIDVSLLATC